MRCLLLTHKKFIILTTDNWICDKLIKKFAHEVSTYYSTNLTHAKVNMHATRQTIAIPQPIFVIKSSASLSFLEN